MKYLEWNNIISAFLFNPANAGKDIYLYLTKNDIISLARPYFIDESDERIWSDFVKSIKLGLPGSNGNIVLRSRYTYSKNNLVGKSKLDGTPATIEDIPVLYPPYISYLIFFVLPLIEEVDDNRRSANNYYGRLNSFLQSLGINQNIGTNDFSINQINDLWENLAHWANVENNGDLGFFNVVPFTNKNWVYVGKIFSQCVLPPRILNRLPELFESIGLVPNFTYDTYSLQGMIISSSTTLIPKNTLDFLKKYDELSRSIIQTILNNYKKWTGETHEEIEEQDGLILKKKRNYTIAPLFLQFKVNRNEEEIKFTYRMYSLNDYPEDLKFGQHENLYEINGWSKTLLFEFKERLELTDNFNKWIAKFPDLDVRLFINAGIFQLSNDFWIETHILSKTEQMYLLCRNNKREIIKEWGGTFRGIDFKEEELDGLPQGYSLFWLRNPICGLSKIPILTLHSEKRIELVNGLRVDFRTYINDFLPEIEIVNSEGSERVYLQYSGETEKRFLSKKQTQNNRWLLPTDLFLDSDFYIKVEDENFSGNELAYSIISTGNAAMKVDGTKLPMRDSFGRNKIIDSEQYCLGNNIVTPKKSSQRVFYPASWIFTPQIQEVRANISTTIFNNHCGNRFCDFLALKNILTTEAFFKAFEFYYSKLFSEQSGNTAINLTKLKRASLSFYDFIGILDYDYENKSIVMSPAQFVFIPTAKGRKVLLIGARDSALVEKIIDTASKYNLQVETTKQFSSNERLLLPDVITIRSFQQEYDNYGEKGLKALAAELNIKFTSDYFPQVALQDFSANIVDYENTLQEIDENDYDWARYVFDPETLTFNKSETSTFDRSFSLVKYKLNEYTYQFKLWKDNKCYQVDMNWGRFIALKHFNKNVILFDSSNNKVAIPIETPLPRLLSEAIMLLSGLAPDFKEIDGRKYRVYENVISIFTQNLFRLKLNQTPINKIL
ncbi:hypothetical protein [Sphingobacterium siyangense]|uniref:Uncharacterized protein n=1 Tax=Sphingobacterium siyangense TaxID=459529 RepID=A0A562MB96_9SPHI|nr:hypothetical protein [Sphingobacterium siyangense]TWI17209.1 hypothetical protein IQ31_03945 [Sphingobacterium siyangense]